MLKTEQLLKNAVRIRYNVTAKWQNDVIYCFTEIYYKVIPSQQMNILVWIEIIFLKRFFLK